MADLTPTGARGRTLLPTAVVWDESLLAYDFGGEHPMAPLRLELTASLARELGIFSRPNVSLEAPFVASDEQLLTVHEADYLEAVKAAGSPSATANHERGLGTEDDPIFPGMHEASARLVGGSLAAVEQIISGKAVRAVNFAGGMHHAHHGRAGGFCIYNDAAAAIARLLDSGVQRVAYIDIDAHHGDGTQEIFYDDPRVLTVSLHESGNVLYPGTGFAEETGGPHAEGQAVNIALPAYTQDAGWLRAFHSVVPQVVRAFAPEVIVSQHGCDSHTWDQLTHLCTSVDGQREAALSIASLAHELCEDRWLATGGGGYDVVRVVPRVWNHVLGISSGEPLPLRTEVPSQWRESVAQRFGTDVPELMGDGVELYWRSWEAGYNPADSVDRTIMLTRKECFPLLGLDPWFD